MGVGWWVAFVWTFALVQADCTLPSFNQGVIGSGLCVPQGTLPASKSCNVSCSSNYTATGGTSTYTCTGASLTETASLTCTPSCVVTLPMGVVGTGTNPCPSAGYLARNSNCSVQCDSANNFSTAFAGSNAYICPSGTGTVQQATLRCTPCVLPNPLLQTNTDTSSGCQPGGLLGASQSCNVVCNSNYSLSGGNSQYSCSGTGTLTTTAVTCQAQSCTMPVLKASVARGSCPNPGQNIAAGSNCAVQCAQGYVQTSGDPSVNCTSLLANGYSLVCGPAPCNVTLVGVAGTDVDSCVLGSLLQSGQSCSLKCLSGYQPSGTSMNAVCTLGNLDVQINCQSVSCALPSEFDTGVITSPNNGCTPGAQITDSRSCNLRCDTGYTPQTDKPFTCNSGVLSTTGTPPPWCIANSCNLPNSYPQSMQTDPSGPHAQACSTSVSLASSTACDVKCDNTTTSPSSVGTFYYACFAGQLISSPTGQCLRPGGCYFPPLDASYDFGGSCSGGPLTNNSVCSVTCANGYAGNTSLAINFGCVNGQLSSPARICTPAPCTLPNNMAAGVTGCMSGGSLASNGSCTMGCGPGTMLANSQTAGSQYRCSYGTLSQSRPFDQTGFCVPLACTLPQAPAGYAYLNFGFGRCTMGQTLANNTDCGMTCASGYNGANGNYECQNGVLHFTFNCTPSDCSYTVPAPTATVGWQAAPSGVCNQSCVLKQGAQTVASGTCCEFKCGPGYMNTSGVSQIGCPVPSVNNCGGGLCDANPATANLVCTANPCTLPSAWTGVGVVAGGCSANGQLTGSGPGSTCSVACDTNYTPFNGSAQYSCSLGVLTAPTLTCIESACTLPNPLKNQLTGQTGGPNNSSCTAGSSLPSRQSCDVQCKSPLNESANGGTRTYSCVSGTRTDPTLVCVSSTQCALPLAFGVGITSGGAQACNFPGYLNNGATCRIACANGYSPVQDANVNDASYTCNNGVLNPGLMSCAPNNCTVSLAASEAPSANCSNGVSLASGSSCTSGCQSGYIQTSIVRTCSLGNINISGTCAPAPCQLPSSFALGTQLTGGPTCLLGGQVASGSACTLICGAGYTSTGTFSAPLSCSYGNLSAVTFSCQPQNCTYTQTGTTLEIGDNSTDKPCTVGQSVTNGDICYTKCGPGTTGQSAFVRTCSLGVLSARDDCAVLDCPLPDWAANVNGAACPPDTLAPGTFCTVGCEPVGLYSTIGANAPNNRAQLSCSTKGVLNAYTFQCFPLPCSLPYSLGANVNANASTCQPTSRLDSGSSCTVACNAGYALSPAAQNTYSCQAGRLSEPGTCLKAGLECVVPDFTLTANYDGESQADVFACSPGQILPSGGSCRVTCATNFTADMGSRIYSCAAGMLTSPTLVCTGPPCSFPNNLAVGVTSMDCVTGGSLAYGASCSVSCAGPAYSPANTGTTKYTCGTTLSTPTLQCTSVPCALPAIVPVGLRFTSCRVNGTLGSGRTCSVACAAGFQQNGTGTVYSCVPGTPLGALPALSPPTIQCLPKHCTLASPLVAGYQTVSCPPNSTDADCMMTCASGYNSVLANGMVGPVTAICGTDGGSFTLAGCSPDKVCGVASNYVGYSVTCGSPSTPSKCTGTVCAPGYYGSPLPFCTVQNGNMGFSGCTACRSVCPAGQSALPCNSSYQPPCMNCSVNTFNNGTNLSCTSCPFGTCSSPGASFCTLCPPQQVTIAGDSNGISSGALAAAIIVPLLVIALAILACWAVKKRRDNNSIANLAKSRQAHQEHEAPTEPMARTSSNISAAGSRKGTEAVEMERGNDGLWRQKPKV